MMTPTTPHTAGRPPRGLFGRVLRRFTTSEAELRDETLRTESTAAGCLPIGEAPLRRPVKLRGSISVVTLNPRGVNRWLEGVLSDGSGEVTLIWMGRRVVRGIDAGRKLQVEGVITLFEGRPTIYNPKYSLLPD
ncbi:MULTISPECIES: OB-fold nucleic acid binding domain-containing protein [unclassified Luteococcus]|uniref:OB-fold nucleic acid binding domain-containing protein n=1 Tax=unclassified Luteococcus TaxID=2639923 RepID=UPI00313CC178